MTTPFDELRTAMYAPAPKRWWSTENHYFVLWIVALAYTTAYTTIIMMQAGDIAYETQQELEAIREVLTSKACTP